MQNQTEDQGVLYESYLFQTDLIRTQQKWSDGLQKNHNKMASAFILTNGRAPIDKDLATGIYSILELLPEPGNDRTENHVMAIKPR